MQWLDLPILFPEFEGPKRWVPLLQRHQELLDEAAPAVRVTSVSAAESIQRHYAESLEIWRIALAAAGSATGLVADVGSGGGFPGLVMACVTPASHFALIEPLQKRARLLESIAASLGLQNVEVLAQRAEDAGRGHLRDRCDVVTARAVSPLSELLEYTAPLARRGGLLVLPKGSAGADELAAASNALSILRCSPPRWERMRPKISETLSVLLVPRAGVSSKLYPRKPGTPAKIPL